MTIPSRFELPRVQFVFGAREAKVNKTRKTSGEGQARYSYDEEEEGATREVFVLKDVSRWDRSSSNWMALLMLISFWVISSCCCEPISGIRRSINFVWDSWNDSMGKRGSSSLVVVVIVVGVVVLMVRVRLMKDYHLNPTSI